MDWMGYKRIDETMLYVHFAGAHTRPIPDDVLAAGAAESDPNRRVLAMLGTRGTHAAPTESERPNYRES